MTPSESRYDEPEKKFREYQARNGKWDLLTEDGGAVSIVADSILGILKPMYHLQSFIEAVSPHTKKTPAANPSSRAVNEKINMYVERLKGTGEVLSGLKKPLKSSFVNNPYTHILLFENGYVDLKDGLLQGAAPPDWLITQSVPRVYDPNVDTAALVGVRISLSQSTHWSRRGIGQAI